MHEKDIKKLLEISNINRNTTIITFIISLILLFFCFSVKDGNTISILLLLVILSILVFIISILVLIVQFIRINKIRKVCNLDEFKAELKSNNTKYFPKNNVCLLKDKVYSIYENKIIMYSEIEAVNYFINPLVPTNIYLQAVLKNGKKIIVATSIDGSSIIGKIENIILGRAQITKK